jgi:hypothetical protein
LENSDVFTWEPSDLSGVPREVIEHHLVVCPEAHLINQKVRRQAQDWQDFIVKEVRKLEKAKVEGEPHGGPKAQWGHADVHRLHGSQQSLP